MSSVVNRWIGVAVGETVDLPLTFPETYGNAELAGQDVVFTVTVNSIKELPEITDAFISEKTEFDTVDAYKEDNHRLLRQIVVISHGKLQICYMLLAWRIQKKYAT